MESDASNILVGTILRKTICTLLKHKAFAPGHGASSADLQDDLQNGLHKQGSHGGPSPRIYPLVAWGTLECIYPRYPDVDQLNLSDADR